MQNIHKDQIHVILEHLLYLLRSGYGMFVVGLFLL